MSSTRIALIALALATTLVACAKPPQVEIDAAKGALASVEAAEAATYAPEALAEVSQAVAAADAEVAAQAEKLAFLRNYDTAKQLALDAAAKAETAKQAAIDAKAAAKAAAEAAVQATNDALANAQALLASLDECKKKPKDFASQVELLKGSLDGLAARVAELPNHLTSEKFSAASEQAAALAGEIATYATDIEAVKAKISC